MIVKIPSEIIVYDRKIQGLCKKPYHGHSKGCPNFGKKEGCPPLPLLKDFLDLQKESYVIFTSFNVGEFAETIRLKYLDWNTRQCYNPRYWQPKARKLQRAEEKTAKENLNLEVITNSPEAFGVNVTNLMKQIEINLTWGWPPKHTLVNQEYLKNKTYLVSLGGFLKT
ncbi:MAG: hypothetical protein KKC26_05100 [Nanoarchaeota archaeon]|nr:hypothetical protein [Nanoarchaeota archaeon]MBU1849840.1 hypothetical protein [Nanoarchaeota archaeon]